MHVQDPEWVAELRREVKNRLKDHNSTQVALARYLNISPKHVNQFLRGLVTGNPVLLSRIAAAVGLRIVLEEAPFRPVLAPRKPHGRRNAVVSVPEDLDDALGED